jgi:hypothetical protein
MKLLGAPPVNCEERAEREAGGDPACRWLALQKYMCGSSVVRRFGMPSIARGCAPSNPSIYPADRNALIHFPY